MMNRIFFEGRDSGISAHLWTGAFAHSVEPQELDDDAALGNDSCLWIVRDRPTVHPLSHGASAFVPEFYEANYAYPLIVWLADSAETPDDFESRMNDISPRNCLGLQIPIDPASGTRRVLDSVRGSVGEFRQSWHVHTERIIPAGVGPGGEAALRLLLARPAWFGGAISLGSRFAETPSLPVRDSAIRGKRVLLATGCESPAVDDETLRSLAQVLNAAGMSVTLRRHHESGLERPPALADVNAWLMEAVCVAA